MDRTAAWQVIARFSKEEFEEKMLLLQEKINSAERRDLMFKFIKGKLSVGYDCRPDLEAYALKSLMPDVYRTLPDQTHPYSKGENWEYDPAKNGQNIIKHGLGFGEVVSYSGGLFGVYSVPCPDDRDGERYVVFSGFVLKRKGAELAMPPKNIEATKCTISITQLRDGRHRFISSHPLGSDKETFLKTIKQKIRKFSSDEQTKLLVVDRAAHFIETYVTQ